VVPGTSLVKVWQEWIAGMRLVKQQHLIASIFIIISVPWLVKVWSNSVNWLCRTYITRKRAVLAGYSAQAIGGLRLTADVRLSKWIRPALLIPLCA